MLACQRHFITKYTKKCTYSFTLLYYVVRFCVKIVDRFYGKRFYSTLVLENVIVRVFRKELDKGAYWMH